MPITDDQKNDAEILAITLSWESLDFLPRLIDSTLRWADEFYVLDTGSTDGSREYLQHLSQVEPRIRYSTVDTDHTTFNRGRCINLLLEELDKENRLPSWLAVIDCDEIFEEGFERHFLPTIRRLPRIYSEVSFQRPTVWYSDSFARSSDIDFREPAFQRYRRGIRYPEEVFHMSRSLVNPGLTFFSNALLLNYELRDPKRSRLQYERLKLIDREWDHLIQDPDDPPELYKLLPAESRPSDTVPSGTRTALTFVAQKTNRILRSVARCIGLGRIRRWIRNRR